MVRLPLARVQAIPIPMLPCLQEEVADRWAVVAQLDQESTRRPWNPWKRVVLWVDRRKPRSRGPVGLADRRLPMEGLHR